MMAINDSQPTVLMEPVNPGHRFATTRNYDGMATPECALQEYYDGMPTSECLFAIVC